MLELHKFLGLLTLVFTAVHLLGLVADTYTKFGFTEILVPLASKWRPWAVGSLRCTCSSPSRSPVGS